MLHPSKVDWADLVYNPITGCLHGCPYCYARRTAKRFSNDIRLNQGSSQKVGSIWILEKPFLNTDGIPIPYPFGFEPTYHKYRLSYPSHRSITPAKIFVGSDSDIFGEWVPDEVIVDVFNACKAAPWNKYFFMTKNLERYMELGAKNLLINGTNVWYGITVAEQSSIRDLKPFKHYIDNLFLNIEPLREDLIDFDMTGADWVVIGTEMGESRRKITAKKEWIENVVLNCKEKKIPYFLKNNLLDIWGEKLIKQYPENIKNIESRILAKNRVFVEQVRKDKDCMYCSKGLQGQSAWRMNAKAYCCCNCLEEKLEAQKGFIR